MFLGLNEKLNIYLLKPKVFQFKLHYQRKRGFDSFKITTYLNKQRFKSFNV